jgi:hypothetical protein
MAHVSKQDILIDLDIECYMVICNKFYLSWINFMLLFVHDLSTFDFRSQFSKINRHIANATFATGSDENDVGQIDVRQYVRPSTPIVGFQNVEQQRGVVSAKCHETQQVKK